ncbi:alanine racemase [Nocardioides currus]|uniref:Alanine racemase n=1 Tax=Nocardioides currus TaxID=2133958 RepID=A0A2R7YZC9_9ACTN|nr:alanine racemase [Nocardioides currus]PUA81738.1 alanine racemase [Nocardioides currus]
MTSTAAARAEIVVDLAAIRHNVSRLRELVGPDVAMMTVVKADGYGHGMVEVARAARQAGSEWLGVATLDEAMALREAGDPGRVLCWLAVPGEEYAAAVAAGIDLTAYTVAELDEIAESGGERARVQLKVDTGLTRGGAARADWPAVFAHAAELEQAGRLDITGIWSHFAASDEPEHPANDAQEAAFREAVALAEELGMRPELRHLANSAATILRPSARFNLVRCGIASYGLDPAPGRTPDLGLVPAMTVRASLAMSKQIAIGDGVSYGHTWIADRDTTVGVVPAGYGEGVPRAAGNLASVWVDDRRRAIRGRVCMDQFVIDLDGDLPPPGTDVVLFGPGDRGEPTAQEWAEALDTINYEIVTRVGGRLARRHVNREDS